MKTASSNEDPKSKVKNYILKVTNRHLTYIASNIDAKDEAYVLVNATRLSESFLFNLSACGLTDYPIVLDVGDVNWIARVTKYTEGAYIKYTLEE